MRHRPVSTTVEVLLQAAILSVAAPLWGQLPSSVVLAILGAMAIRAGLAIKGKLAAGTKAHLIAAAGGLVLGALQRVMTDIDPQSNLGLMPLAVLFASLITAYLLVQWDRRTVAVIASFVSLLLLYRLTISQSLSTSSGVAASAFLMLWALASNLHRSEGIGPEGAAAAKVGLRTTLKVLSVSVPLMILLFLIFPRLPISMFRSQQVEEGRGTTGLSSTMAPGTISSLQKSDQPAFMVSFNGRRPEPHELYWRALVLGNFDGSRWTEVPGIAPAPETLLKTKAPLLSYSVAWFPNMSSPWLAPLDGSVGPVYATFNEQTAAIRMRGDGTFPVPEEPGEKVRVASMRAQMAPSYRLGDVNEADLSVWRQLPPHYNPRTLKLGRQLREQATSDRHLIQEVLNRFNKEPYRYTLSPPKLGRHTVDEFLFDTRAGFCEHYASSFVVLMRASGMPARVVTGYMGGTPFQDGLKVLERDAHAWAEVWLQDQGWVRIDPTDYIHPSRVEPEAARAQLESLPSGILGFARAQLAHAENLWRWAFLDFDQQQQRRLFEKLGLKKADRVVAGIAALFGIVIGVATCSWLVMCWQGRKRLSPTAKLMGRLERKLKPYAVARLPGQTVRSFCAGAAHRLTPRSGQELMMMVKLYEASCYGVRTAESVQQLRKAINSFTPEPAGQLTGQADHSENF